MNYPAASRGVVHSQLIFPAAFGNDFAQMRILFEMWYILMGYDTKNP